MGSGSRSAEEIRQEGGIPTILLGSDASTISEDPNAAVSGAWLAIGVFATAELNSKAMGKWRIRIKWNDREAYGGANMCWGTKADRTIMAGETLAILLAMKSIRKAKGGRTLHRNEDHSAGRQRIDKEEVSNSRT
jgi:hypothetical protein